MKSSSFRLNLIAGTLGVLSISQPNRLDAQTPLGEMGRPLGEEGRPLRGFGRPIGEGAVPLSQVGIPVGEGARPTTHDGRPVGEGARPLSEGGIPVGEGARPTTQDGRPVGEGARPLSEGGIPVGEGARPTTQDGRPVGEGARPLSEGGIPVGEGATPTTQDGMPVGEGAKPLSDSGIPLADYGTPSQQAQELRRRNRAAAMNNPETSGFFGGDAETRRANASKNIAAAAGATPEEGQESVSQENVDDREWSRGAIDSAQSRPRDLFSSDWWEKHPDVLEGDAKYYTAKPAYAWWQGSPWSDLVRVLGMRNLVAPFKYSADRNVVFHSDLIYMNGKPVSSYDDYVHSARSLVDPNPQETGKRQGWYPLGTFAVSSNSETKAATHAFQLAMDSLGNIAGVSVNWPAGKVLPIRGRVDTNTTRVAFSVGGSSTVVVETGLANLTDPYTRVWAHFPNSHSQTWLMTRIRE